LPFPATEWHSEHFCASNTLRPAAASCAAAIAGSAIINPRVMHAIRIMKPSSARSRARHDFVLQPFNHRGRITLEQPL